MQLARSHPIMGAFGAYARRTHAIIPISAQRISHKNARPCHRQSQYPMYSTCNVQRDPSYNRWDRNDLRVFKAIFNGNSNQMLQIAEDTDTYTTDWLKKYKAKSSHALVLRPSSTGTQSAFLVIVSSQTHSYDRIRTDISDIETLQLPKARNCPTGWKHGSCWRQCPCL